MGFMIFILFLNMMICSVVVSKSPLFTHCLCCSHMQHDEHTKNVGLGQEDGVETHTHMPTTETRHELKVTGHFGTTFTGQTACKTQNIMDFYADIILITSLLSIQAV